MTRMTALFSFYVFMCLFALISGFRRDGDFDREEMNFSQNMYHLSDYISFTEYQTLYTTFVVIMAG